MTKFSVLVAFAMLSAASAADAQTFACDASKNQAKIGVRPGNEVAITKDYKHQECRFSVNGAPVGSPPLGAILEGLNGLVSGSMVGQLQSGDVQGLAIVLLSSSPETSPSEDLVSTLREEAQSLARCLDEFVNGKLAAGQFVVQSGTVVCGRLPATPTQVKLELGSVTVSPSGEGMPTDGMLVVAVARKAVRVEHFLFVPRRYAPK